MEYRKIWNSWTDQQKYGTGGHVGDITHVPKLKKMIARMGQMGELLWQRIVMLLVTYLLTYLCIHSRVSESGGGQLLESGTDR